MDSDMLDRSLHYAKALCAQSVKPPAKVQKFKHIHPDVVNAMLVSTLMNRNKVGEVVNPWSIELQPLVILRWGQVHGKSWFQYLHEGYILFLPLTFPSGDHWIVIIMWVFADKYWVRVYNSWSCYRIYDKEIALAAAQACEIMSQTNVAWHFLPCEDLLNQKSKAQRCGIHSLARAVQCMTGQTHLRLNITAVTRVGDWLTAALLLREKSLVHDRDPIPEMSLYPDHPKPSEVAKKKKTKK